MLKHQPDCAFLLDQKGGEQIQRIFEEAFQASQKGKVRLIAACLFYAKREHVYHVDTVTVMMATGEWLPLDHVFEADLVAKLVAGS